MRAPLSSAAVCCLLIALLSGCSPPTPQIELSGPTMGTTWTVRIAQPPEGMTGYVVRTAVEEVLDRIDATMSGYRSDSEIVRFNAAETTEWIDVSGELATVVATAQRIGELTSGALDITVAPLVDVWGFGPAGPMHDLPDAAQLRQVRDRTGYRKLHLREAPPGLRKDDARLSVDLNSIAPGYAVDLVAGRLAELGAGHFMIDIGGEVRARGRNARGERWRIAVERPVEDSLEPFAIVQLPDMAIATSGEYRHFVMRGGQRYSHTIDPRTARPVAHALAAVAVIAPTAMLADAWATAFNVLGPDAGYALAVQRKMPVLFIVPDGTGFAARATPQFERYRALQ